MGQHSGRSPCRSESWRWSWRNKVLFVAGPAAEADNGPEGRNENQEALLMAISAIDGTELARYRLDSAPVFDGMAAANGRLYLSLENGQVLCMAGQ